VFSLSDDDDELDEENIPGFSHPALTVNSPVQQKGKGRAPEQLQEPVGQVSSPHLSGNIGSASNRPPTRHAVGGVQVETRCVGRCLLVDTHMSFRTLQVHRR
jgi:protein YIPF6